MLSCQDDCQSDRQAGGGHLVATICLDDTWPHLGPVNQIGVAHLVALLEHDREEEKDNLSFDQLLSISSI